MRHAVTFVTILLVASAVPFAAAGPLPVEVSIAAPAFVLVGKTIGIAGSYHLLAAPLVANDVRLYVDGVRAGTDTTVVGTWSIPQAFPARGSYSLHAVADGSRLTEATSDAVTVVAAEAPSAARELVVTPVAGAMRVLATWSPPTDDGGAPISAYDILRRDAPGGSWVRAGMVTGAATSATLSVSHGAHVFRVIAMNPVASSPPIDAIITGEPPAPPTIFAAPVHLTDGVRVDAAATGGATQKILVERSPDAGASWIQVGTVPGTAGSIVDRVPTGMHPIYRARALHVVAASEPTLATPTGALPGSASAVSLAIEFDRLRISWSAPTEGGALQGFVILEDDRRIGTVGATGTDMTFSRTTPGTRVFSIVATNAVGDAPAATTSLTLAQASAPALTAALFETDFGGRVELSWTASSDDGGAPIIGYAVTRTPGQHHGARSTIAWIEPGEPLEFADEGLRAGTSYAYEVNAYTVAGHGIASTFEDTVPAIDWDTEMELSHFFACEATVCASVPANGTYHRAGSGAVSYGPVYHGSITRNGVPFEGASVMITIWEESDPEMEGAESNVATTNATGEFTTRWTRQTSVTPASCALFGFHSALGAAGTGALDRFTICP